MACKGNEREENQESGVMEAKELCGTYCVLGTVLGIYVVLLM
jgi:hypothetical protein